MKFGNKMASSKTRSSWYGFFAMVMCGLIVMFVAPNLIGSFGILQLTIFAVMAIFALSQGFVWGFAGIMSFGQAAFLGLGAYAYAVSVANIGDSTLPVLISIVVPMVFAALLGYFMFYGRISDAYIGVITLTVSVIIYQLMNATSGSQYAIGQAELGGFNGIPAIPALNVPGQPDNQLSVTGIWYVAMASLVLVYIFLRCILASRFGRVIVAIKENEMRAQLTGYDPRLYKLLAFIISGGIAGLAGCMYANWGGFISPTIFSLMMSAEAIIFVLVGGLGTLLGPIAGAVLIQGLINVAGTQHYVDSNLGLGAILVAFVLLVPQGIVPVIRSQSARLLSGISRKPVATSYENMSSEPQKDTP